MTDTWAAKVLADVPRYKSGWRSTHGEDIRYADALAAIARMGAGDGLVERATGVAQAQDAYEKKNLSHFSTGPLIRDLLARIAALTAQVADHEKAAQENDPSNLWRFWANKAKEIADNNAALRERVARLEGAVEFPSDWRERAHSFKGMLKLQAAWADGFNAARAALTDGGKDG